MATAKKTAEELKEVREDKVTVFLPPAADGEDNFQLLSVNGIMMKIKRGIAVQIPRAYKEVLDNAQIANKVLAEKIAKASKNA